MLPSSAALDLILCSATWALYRALLVVVVVAAFSSLVRIWGDFVHVCVCGRFIPCVRFLLFLSGDQLTHTNSTFLDQDQFSGSANREDCG